MYRSTQFENSSILDQSSTILISTAKGLSFYVKKELSELGFRNFRATGGGVELTGSFVDCLKCNLHLRTAHHVHFLLSRGNCRNPDDLYKLASAIPWESIIAPDGYVSVVSNVRNESIRDTRFPNMKCKDAIVDRISKKKGRRPDSGPLKDRVVVFVQWLEERCAIFLDTSGEPLTKRGYRFNPYVAPMQESLAAAVVMATDWKHTENLINPMCGSGTLAIESALMYLKRAPGLFRENFGFIHTLAFEKYKHVWNGMRERAEREQKSGKKIQIIASDHDKKAIEVAQENARSANVHEYIEFQHSDFFETTIPSGNGVCIMNPEYGIRLGDSGALETVYSKIGEFFKSKTNNYRNFVFTGNKNLAKKVGLPIKKDQPFLSGKIQCELYEYETE